MRWIRNNKRDAAAFVFAVLALGVFACFLVQGLGSYAEAVIGEAGNLGSAGGSHPHNFTSTSSGIKSIGEDQICIFCHTPHRALTDDAFAGLNNASLLNAPLWNHKLTTATYTVKPTNPTPVANATLANTLALLSTVPKWVDGPSRLCLSCHDGTVGIGEVYTNYGFPTSPETANDIAMDTSHSCLDGTGKLISGAGCNAYIGTDLRTKHVVSIPMNQALLTAAFNNCTTQGGTATIQLQYPWNSATSDVLLRPVGDYNTFGGNPGIAVGDAGMSTDYRYKTGYKYGVQCSTCHDPHYWVSTSLPLDTQGEKMLVTGFNTLCTACHIDC